MAQLPNSSSAGNLSKACPGHAFSSPSMVQSCSPGGWLQGLPLWLGDDSLSPFPTLETPGLPRGCFFVPQLWVPSDTLSSLQVSSETGQRSCHLGKPSGRVGGRQSTAPLRSSQKIVTFDSWFVWKSRPWSILPSCSSPVYEMRT